MISAAALVLALTAASTDPLDAAQTALTRGSYAQAEALALQVARPPREGAALYLAAVARFRAGRPEDALQALDASARAADPPAWAFLQYNRGACLSALERYDEAERAFLEAAAADASLAPAALVNAAYAALDGGAAGRALSSARRAKKAGAAADVVADLETQIQRGLGGQRSEDAAAPARAEYLAGIAAFDGQRYGEARSRFLRATELDPAEARSRIMAGASALNLGERAEARADLEQALRLSVDEAEARAARDYLDALSPGLASRGRGFEALARAGGGFDSSAGVAGALGTQNLAPLAAGVASATASAALAVSYRARTLGASAEAGYGLDELAYLNPAAADFSLQRHALLGSLEWALGEVRLGATAGGQLWFAGLSDFRAAQAAALGEAWAALDEREWTSTRLDFGWAARGALRSEFEPLAGPRAEVAIGQQGRVRAMTVDATYRFRYDGMGSLTQTAQVSPGESCLYGCTQQAVTPYGYRSHAAALTGRAALGAKVRLEIAGGVEWRSYLAHESLTLVTQRPYLPAIRDVELDRLRQDVRFFATFGGAVRVHRAIELLARYEVTVNRSNVDAESFAKHVLVFEAGLAF